MDLRKRKGFTLIELLVVISIIALLLSMLMPSLSKAKQVARAVVCKSNLKQWALAVAVFHNEANGKYWSGNNYWPPALEPYTGHMPDFRFCPSANKFKGNNYSCPPTARDVSGSTFSAWDIKAWQPDLKGHTNGSYGLNEWVMDPTKEANFLDRYGFPLEEHWANINNIKNPDDVPLFVDCLWFGSWPKDSDPPPIQPDEWQNDNNMKRNCIDRHSSHVNASFTDGSVRKVGLKELWKLKWHRSYNTSGEWTIAGGATKAQWDEAAPWMSKYKMY